MPAKSLKTPYTERVIAFIDVLGFGSLVFESATSSTAEGESIRRISDAILHSLDRLKETLIPSGGFVFTQFSDSFVISTDGNNSARSSDLSAFASAVDVVIHCFLDSNLLLRGGITRGKLIHNKRLLFGPAMNRAYDLERLVARVPRIIFDPKLPELANTILPDGIARDVDGVFYVDYFSRQRVFYLVPEWLHAIQKCIEAMPRSVKLHEKRAWLVKKFNVALSGFSYDEFKSRLDDYVDDSERHTFVDQHYYGLLKYARELRQM